MVAHCDRLEEAELELCRFVDREFMRELDVRNYTAKDYSSADLYPRNDEEQIYTALVLAGMPPPRLGEISASVSRYELVERMKNAKLDLVEKRMFDGRFMTWFAAQSPEYHDPRRHSTYNDNGFDEYARRAVRAGAVPAPPQPSMSAMYRRLVDKITGRVP